MKKNLWKITLLFFCGCAYLTYVSDPFLTIPNFHRVDQAVLRGGQPTQKGLEVLKSLGVKTIINLRGENDKLKWEREFTKKLDMSFYHIPMSVYSQPTDEQIIKFLKVVINKENQPVFVHCESGRDRTGAMVALYRVAIYNWTPKEAYQEAKKFGFWPYRGKALLKKFILQLKDKRELIEKVKEEYD